jgi:glutamate transport system substrate-binding protein
VTGERSGFDVDIARWIAASLGFAEDKIEFQPIASANREQAIVNGDIDYYVGTYSITDKRKQQISFAGPYFITGQGLLVAADNDKITGKDSLTADDTVCSATARPRSSGSRTDPRQDQGVRHVLGVRRGPQERSGGCRHDRRGDPHRLRRAGPDKLKVVGEPFSEERYGVGIAKGDTALQTFINTMFTDGGSTWQAIFDKNLGASGVKATQPEVDAAADPSGGSATRCRRHPAPRRRQRERRKAARWSHHRQPRSVGRSAPGTLVLFFGGGSSRSCSASSSAPCASRRFPSPAQSARSTSTGSATPR